MDMTAYMDVQCQLLGLELAPEHRPGVLRYLQLVATMAPRVMDFELAPADEVGHLFVPVEAPSGGTTSVPASAAGSGSGSGSGPEATP